MDAMNFYERLPLFGTGIALGLFLIVSHAFLLAKAAPAQQFLKRLHRNHTAGQVLIAIGMIWFWLLIAPPNKGILSSLAMDLGDFNRAKPLLRLFIPICLVGLTIAIKEYLSIRALGLIGLMAAAPLLEAAFLKDPVSRLLIPTYCYALIIVSLYLVGMPYLFRDAILWASATANRWKGLCLAGIIYGTAILICALLFWRGY